MSSFRSSSYWHRHRTGDNNGIRAIGRESLHILHLSACHSFYSCSALRMALQTLVWLAWFNPASKSLRGGLVYESLISSPFSKHHEEPNLLTIKECCQNRSGMKTKHRPVNKNGQRTSSRKKQETQAAWITWKLKVTRQLLGLIILVFAWYYFPRQLAFSFSQATPVTGKYQAIPTLSSLKIEQQFKSLSKSFPMDYVSSRYLLFAGS